MKNSLKLVLVMAAFCAGVSAQTIKLAHINMQELVMSMPEYETFQETLQRYAQDLENQMEELIVERNRKFDEFQRLTETWSDLVRQMRADELNTMQQRIQMFQEQAHEEIMQEQNRLLQPVLEKANSAIEAVAREQEITYVISSEALLFRAANSVDLLPAVRRHLGINN